MQVKTQLAGIAASLMLLSVLVAPVQAKNNGYEQHRQIEMSNFTARQTQLRTQINSEVSTGQLSTGAAANLTAELDQLSAQAQTGRTGGLATALSNITNQLNASTVSQQGRYKHQRFHSGNYQANYNNPGIYNNVPVGNNPGIYTNNPGIYNGVPVGTDPSVAGNNPGIYNGVVVGNPSVTGNNPGIYNGVVVGNPSVAGNNPGIYNGVVVGNPGLYNTNQQQRRHRNHD